MWTDPSSIVAISGLGGHAFGSFKEKDGEHMWLRDALPHHITSGSSNIARVMVYGYESSLVRSKSTQNLEDLATSFRASLLALASDTTHRPIIFVAHSLGGLIVKQVCLSIKPTIQYSYGAIGPHIYVEVRERR